MGYAERINRLEALPREKQAGFFEFAEFLSARYSTPTGKDTSRAEASCLKIKVTEGSK